MPPDRQLEQIVTEQVQRRPTQDQRRLRRRHVVPGMCDRYLIPSCSYDDPEDNWDMAVGVADKADPAGIFRRRDHLPGRVRSPIEVDPPDRRASDTRDYERKPPLRRCRTLAEVRARNEDRLAKSNRHN